MPALLRISWRIWELITWPAAVRQLKRAGFRRTGFMTWESGPADLPGDRNTGGGD